jgi:hypothetical protein
MNLTIILLNYPWAARHIIIIVFASFFSAIAVVGVAFIWTRMRRRRDHLHHDGMQNCILAQATDNRFCTLVS